MTPIARPVVFGLKVVTKKRRSHLRDEDLLKTYRTKPRRQSMDFRGELDFMKDIIDGVSRWHRKSRTPDNAKSAPNIT